jgi:serine/threonine protein kinase
MLTDFGIAKGCDDLTITSTGQMIGSPAYMSPEQAAGRPIDHRSDIFSLGIIMYEIIAGKKPFNGNTYQEMVASIMSSRPESLQQLRVDVNPEIEEQVSKALVKDADSRYQSVEEFADRIYTELQRYKIPPVKKLISSFLSNPIKVTTKLRSDKISNHMENALYYVTMGEGRLKEAEKEFQEVLRFDKNNKAAKEYLKKLKSQKDDEEKKAGPPKKIKLKKWHIFSACGLMAIIVAVLLTKLLLGIKYNTETVHNLLRSTTSNPDTIAVAKGDNASSPDKNTGLTKSDNSTADAIPAENKPSVATRENKPAVIKKSTLSRRNASGYDYPHQSLKDYGTIAIRTNVPADIYIDKIEYGKTNGPPIKLSEGRHFVEVMADGYRRMTRRVFTEKGESIEMDITLFAN